MTTEPVYPQVASNGDLVVPVQPPESREAVAVVDYDGPVTGERVVVLQPTSWVFDLRAVTEKYRDGRDRWVVDVVPESDYYANRLDRVATLNAGIVFVERPRS